MPDLSAQNEYYAAGYREGFHKADDELTKSTKQLAMQNAKNDARLYDTYQNEVPEGLKRDLYISEYQTSFKTYESEYFEELETLAKNKAREIVFNRKDEKEALNVVSGKGQEVYQSSLKNNITQYQKEIKTIKQRAKKSGYEDGFANESEHYSSIAQYAEDAVYKDFYDGYQKSYQAGQHDRFMQNVMVFAGAAIVLTLTVIFVMRKRHKKNVNIK